MNRSRRPTRTLVMWAAAAVFTLLFFTGAVLVSLVVHLGTPPAKRILARWLAESHVVKGNIIIDEVEQFSAGAFSGLAGRVVEPEGTAVLAIRGGRGHFSFGRLVRSLLSH